MTIFLFPCMHGIIKQVLKLGASTATGTATGTCTGTCTYRPLEVA